MQKVVEAQENSISTRKKSVSFFFVDFFYPVFKEFKKVLKDIPSIIETKHIRDIKIKRNFLNHLNTRKIAILS